MKRSAKSTSGLKTPKLVRPRYRKAEPDYMKRILSAKAIAMLWSEFYQGTGDPVKMSRAYDVIMLDYKIPRNALKAIWAVQEIHDGDMGVPGPVIKQLLEHTGAIESGYATRTQAGGPARSFWQIEPATARDLMENSKKLFGKKWQTQFGRFDRHRLSLANEFQLQLELESRDDLGASFCAMKWIVSAHKAIIETLKQQT